MSWQEAQKSGSGTGFTFLRGTHILTGETVAIKILEKNRIREVADVERVSREILILKRLRHHQVVHLHEVVDTPKQIYLIMEFANGGELFDYIVAHQRIKERQAALLFHQICDGVQYLHDNGVIHRDLKSQNIFLMKTGRVLLGDFGIASRLDAPD